MEILYTLAALLVVLVLFFAVRKVSGFEKGETTQASGEDAFRLLGLVDEEEEKNDSSL